MRRLSGFIFPKKRRSPLYFCGFNVRLLLKMGFSNVAILRILSSLKNSGRCLPTIFQVKLRICILSADPDLNLPFLDPKMHQNAGPGSSQKCIADPKTQQKVPTGTYLLNNIVPTGWRRLVRLPDFEWSSALSLLTSSARLAASWNFSKSFSFSSRTIGSWWRHYNCQVVIIYLYHTQYKAQQCRYKKQIKPQPVYILVEYGTRYRNSIGRNRYWLL